MIVQSQAENAFLSRHEALLPLILCRGLQPLRIVFLCDWEVAGPYIQKGKKYNELHDIPFGPELPDVDVIWLPTTIISDDKHPVLVNIDKSIMQFNDSVAYLRTEITSDAQKPTRLEIYTDDGVKAWLRRQPTHAQSH